MLKSLSQVQNLAWLIYPLFTVFGLLISQRPRMLDTCPPIDFSIFISLGIFKVVSLFNYQFSFVSFEIAYLLYLIYSILSRTFFIFFYFFRCFSFFFSDVLYVTIFLFSCQYYFFIFFTNEKLVKRVSMTYVSHQHYKPFTPTKKGTFPSMTNS